MKVSAKTFFKFVGLATGAFAGGPLLAALGGTCGGFVGDLFASEDEGGWALGQGLSSLCGSIFSSKVQPLFDDPDVNHDLRRAGARALIRALDWKRTPGPLAAALLKTDGFKGIREQKRELLKRVFNDWRENVQAALDAADKGDGVRLDTLLPTGNDDAFTALADGKMSAEEVTKQAWAGFYDRAFQPVLDDRVNKDSLKEFDLLTLKARMTACLASVYPSEFSQVVKSGDYRKAWIAYQKTLLTAIQRSVKEMGVKTGLSLTKIEERVDLLLAHENKWQRELTKFLAEVRPSLEGQWKETREIKAICSSFEKLLVSYREDVQKIDPLALYKDALFEAYASYVEIGHPIVGGTTMNARPALIGDIFVEPWCSPEVVSPAQMEAILEDKATPPSEDLLMFIQKVFTGNDLRRVVLLGDPGMGKSTLIRWLTVAPLLTGARRRKARVLPVSLPECLKSAIPLPFIVRDLVRYLPDDPQVWDWDALTDAFRQFRASNTAIKPLLSPYDGSDAAFESLLKDPNALFLIDGLDEIGSPLKREKMSEAIMEGFNELPDARFLITSRVVGYEDAPVHERADPSMMNELLAELVYLAPFTDGQQDKYASLWFRVRMGEAEGNARATALLAEVRRKKSIRIISRIPNLLCMMALLKVHGVPLPDGRAELYAAISKAYLDTIQEARGIEASVHGHSLPCSREMAEKWLAVVAMHLQMRRVGKGARSNEEEGEEILATLGDLRTWLEPVFQADKPGENVKDLLADFLRFITQRTAFLLERGDGLYGFAHLSFLEYYTACWMEMEFRRLLNRRQPKGWQHFDLCLTEEFFRVRSQNILWHEPLHFLAEILSKNEDDIQSLLEWQFPDFSQIPDLNSSRLLARLSIDKKVAFQKDQRTAIWSRLWRYWLFRMPEDSREHPWNIAPELLAISDDLPRVLEVLRSHLSTQKTLIFDHCVAVTDLSFLSQMTELKRLSFKGCLGLNSESLKALSDLPNLEELRLSDCIGISQLNHLAGMNYLKRLDLSHCPGVSDLSGLQGLKGLQSLHLENCSGVSDLSGLQGLDGLEWLHICICAGVSDLSDLQRLEGLQTLHISVCAGVSDLSSLQGLDALKSLYLSGCVGVSDLSSLQRLEGLQTLYLSDCPGVSDLSGLQGLERLQTLMLEYCSGVSDLSGLQGLEGLQTLDLSHCPGVSDLSGLQRLEGLQTLHLSDCSGVSDLSGLQGLEGLQTLDLWDCPGVSDLSGLQGLKKLRSLVIKGCTGIHNLEDQVEALRKALPLCTIRES
jgi:Leucine-rich repeat (LRR) protein